MAKTIKPGDDIPHDDISPNDLKPIYSTNKLKNSNAEKGTLVDWETRRTSVSGSGADDSNHSFRLAENDGWMRQVIPAEGSQPADFRVGGYYLPEKAARAEDVKVGAYVKVTYTYADGSIDTILVPVRGAVSNGA